MFKNHCIKFKINIDNTVYLLKYQYFKNQGINKVLNHIKQINT